MRYIDLMLFLDAPRLQAGLRPDEIPTIPQTGKLVLSRDDVAAVRSSAENQVVRRR